MSKFVINNVRIAGVASCVPKTIIENIESTLFESKVDCEKYIQSTGVERRRIVDEKTCSSDLCYKAATKIMHDLRWDKESIDLLIFVSQTRDYIYPMTSCILQERLGLKTHCMSFDMTIGCSGWCYGLSVVASLLQNGGMKRALLLNGETISKSRSPHDRVNLITGDAGTATAIEFSIGVPSMYFDMNTDGSGYKAIIIPDGGYRNMVTPASLVEHIDDDGVMRNNLQSTMDGASVFSFAISKVPLSIKNLIAENNIAKVDYFLLHQANKFIINKIAKKIGEGKSEIPICLDDFGNTSSTSIPLLITTRLNHKIQSKKCVACGFGVGLSWASVYFETDAKFVCSELIEY